MLLGKPLLLTVEGAAKPQQDCGCRIPRRTPIKVRVGRSPEVVGPPPLCVSAQTELVFALEQIERPVQSATSKRLRPIIQRYALSAEHNADRSATIASPLVRQYAPRIRAYLQKA